MLKDHNDIAASCKSLSSNMRNAYLSVLEKAEEIFAKDGYLEPVVFALDQGGRIISMAIPDLSSLEEKKAASDMLKEWLRDQEAAAYIFVCEGWASTDLRVKPSKSPDRKEIVSVALTTRERSVMTVYDVVRGEGKPSLKLDGTVEELTEPPGLTLFGNLLESAPLTIN